MFFLGMTIQRQQVEVFDNCKANGFQEPQCAKWLDEMQLQECRENKDVESDECKKYRTWVIARSGTRRNIEECSE